MNIRYIHSYNSTLELRTFFCSVHDNNNNKRYRVHVVKSILTNFSMFCNSRGWPSRINPLATVLFKPNPSLTQFFQFCFSSLRG